MRERVRVPVVGVRVGEPSEPHEAPLALARWQPREVQCVHWNPATLVTLTVSLPAASLSQGDQPSYRSRTRRRRIHGWTRLRNEYDPRMPA